MCAAVATLVASTVMAAAAGLYRLAGRDRALTVCGADPPDRPPALIAASGRSVTRSFDPPGFVCVFTERGTVVGRLHLGLWP